MEMLGIQLETFYMTSLGLCHGAKIGQLPQDWHHTTPTQQETLPPSPLWPAPLGFLHLHARGVPHLHSTVGLEAWNMTLRATTEPPPPSECECVCVRTHAYPTLRTRQLAVSGLDGGQGV